jgi:hypothetical protein
VNLEKLRVSLTKARGATEGMDLVHWIKIQRPGFNAGGGVRIDRYAGFDWKAWHDLDRRMHIGRLRSSAGGRDNGDARRRKTASSPALKRSSAAVHQKRRERHQNDQERTANPTAGTRRGDGEARRSHDEQPRRRSSGEDGPAARCTSAQTSDTRGSLAERQFHKAAPKRRTGGETTANGRNRSGGVHAAAN